MRTALVALLPGLMFLTATKLNLTGDQSDETRELVEVGAFTWPAFVLMFALRSWDLFFALGIASAALHAEGMLSLSAYWAVMSLTPTLPLVPLLVIHLRHPSPSRRT